MDKKKINVAVTGLNAIDSPGPGVSVIRGLRESTHFDVRIIGLAYESLEPGIYMDNIVDCTYLIPFPSTGVESLRQRIEYIHSRESIDVIIPNFDAELFSFMRLENDFKQMGISMFLPTTIQFEERQKVNLNKFGKKYQIEVPESKVVNNEKELMAAAIEMGYPVMVKGKYYEAYTAFNYDQALGYFTKLAYKWGYPIVIQKYIKGTELNVIGLGDGKGVTISAVAMRKQFITDKGKAWAGITIEDEKLIALAQQFVKNTQWQGAFEMEIMKSEDEKYYLMEINPRIPAWVYLAVAVNHNIPEAVVELALGKDVKPFEPYKAGVMFVRYSYDMIVNRENFETLAVNGEL